MLVGKVRCAQSVHLLLNSMLLPLYTPAIIVSDMILDLIVLSNFSI